MPRYYRIAQDTGMKEYDDSCEPYEGVCPKCKKLHSGLFAKCDECIGEEEDLQWQQRQSYLDSLELEED